MVKPTGRGLLIAEKSSARQEIENAYKNHLSEFGFSLDFQQFAGHVTQLRMPGEMREEWKSWDIDNLPMIPEESEWKYEILKKDANKEKRYQDVLDTLSNGNYDFIINAGDFEREGQLIQDAFFSTLPPNLQGIPVYRLWANDMTEKSLVEGLKNLLSKEDNIPNAGTVKDLSAASFIRARFDWLLGLNSTQVLSLKSNSHINSGRVKMPVLNIIVQREKAVRDFVVKPFWTIKYEFQHANGMYTGILVDEENNPRQFFDQKEAQDLANQIAGSNTGVITSVSVKKAVEKAPKFYAISNLQGDAANIYGISMSDSLAALQKLYERKILSYPRTDSHSITTEMAEDTKALISTTKSVPELANFTNVTDAQIEEFKKNKHFVNNADARAHTALMPIAGQIVEMKTLTEVEQQIFYLVSRSLLLAFMPDLVKEKTEIITSVGEFKFKTNGSRILEKGWSQAVPEYSSNDQAVPQVTQDDSVTMDVPSLKEGKTTPPKRYNTSTLINLLENVARLLENDEEKLAMKNAEGLGRPSTRTDIINSLITGKMISVRGKKQEYSATDFGISVIDNLGNSQLISPQLTARWEAQLQEVEAGKKDAGQLYLAMVEYTKTIVDQLKTAEMKIEHAPSFGNDPVGQLPNGNDVKEAGNGFYDSEFAGFLDERKQAEENGTMQPEFHGFWLSKTIDTPKMKMTGSFTKKDVAALIAGKSITKHFLWKESGKESDTSMHFDFEQNRIQFEFSKSDATASEINVPGHTVSLVKGTKDGKAYEFYSVKDQDREFSIWSTVAGYSITPEDVKVLLDGQQLVDKKFVGKSGKEFNAGLELKNDKLEFVFDNKPQGQLVDTIDGVKVYKGSGKTKDDKEFTYFEIESGSQAGRIYTPMAGAEITIDDIVSLISHGKFHKDNFVSKKGSPFSADVVMKGGKASFDF